MFHIRFAVATLSQQMRCRVYSPSDGNELAYKVDDAFFSANQTRRFAIRESLAGELENGHDFAHAQGLATLYAQRPPLWMLVISSGNGTYRVFPIYRGAHFFPVVCQYRGTFAQCSNDAACLALFDECDLRGGCDGGAWGHWERIWKDALAHAAVIQQAKLEGRVH
jgi:hypothetical protein